MFVFYQTVCFYSRVCPELGHTFPSGICSPNRSWREAADGLQGTVFMPSRAAFDVGQVFHLRRRRGEGCGKPF